MLPVLKVGDRANIPGRQELSIVLQQMAEVFAILRDRIVEIEHVHGPVEGTAGIPHKFTRVYPSAAFHVPAWMSSTRFELGYTCVTLQRSRGGHSLACLVLVSSLKLRKERRSKATAPPTRSAHGRGTHV